jgi:hypothetical protein
MAQTASVVGDRLVIVALAHDVVRAVLHTLLAALIFTDASRCGTWS